MTPHSAKKEFAGAHAIFRLLPPTPSHMGGGLYVKTFIAAYRRGGNMLGS